MSPQWFTIAPTIRISGLCHSIVRGEPYTTCSIGCTYCYAQWHRGPPGNPTAIPGVLSLIDILGDVRGKGLYIPVRVAALSDPFQPAEKQWRLVLRLLKKSIVRKVHVILNTKLSPPGQEYWDVMEKAAASDLLLLQVSITSHSVSRDLLRIVEPRAPEPDERLRVIEKASSLDIPVVARIQPFIPGISDNDLESLVSSIASAGAKMIILEFLRAEKKYLENLSKILGKYSSIYNAKWESYTPRTTSEEPRLLHPPLDYRLRIAEELSRLARRAKIGFQTCKEGLFHLHHPFSMDCCGFGYLSPTPHRRPHLADLYKVLVMKTSISLDQVSVNEICRLENSRLLCSDKLGSMPRWLRRSFVLHERRLEKMLRIPEYVLKLSPAIGFGEKGYFARYKPLSS